MDYEIVPAIVKGFKYPFDKLEIGEAFRIPSGEARRVSGYATHWVKKYAPEKKFSICRISEDMHQCARIR